MFEMFKTPFRAGSPARDAHAFFGGDANEVIDRFEPCDIW
jgi:hypothetical protein